MHPAVRFLILSFWVCTFCLPEAAAVPRKQPSPPRQESLSAVDASFVLQVIRSNWAEMGFARLALEKAQNPEVQRFAEASLRAHQQANREVMQLAQQHGVSVPDSLDPRDRASHFRLKALDPGKLFDMSYLAVSAENHSTMLKSYRLQARYADDEAVRRWARKAHQDQRQQLWQSKKMMVLLSQDRLVTARREPARRADRGR